MAMRADEWWWILPNRGTLSVGAGLESGFSRARSLHWREAVLREILGQALSAAVAHARFSLLSASAGKVSKTTEE